jgi:hypothetical protein
MEMAEHQGGKIVKVCLVYVVDVENENDAIRKHNEEVVECMTNDNLRNPDYAMTDEQWRAIYLG